MIYDKYKGIRLYLLNVFDNAYIVNIETPTIDYTIEEYNNWKDRYIENAICLTSNYTPQTFRNGDIKNFICIDEIIDEELRNHNLKLEDVTVPFLGGIQGFDFRILLRELFDAKDFYGCSNIIRNYIRDLFGQIVKSKQ